VLVRNLLFLAQTTGNCTTFFKSGVHLNLSSELALKSRLCKQHGLQITDQLFNVTSLFALFGFFLCRRTSVPFTICSSRPTPRIHLNEHPIYSASVKFGINLFNFILFVFYFIFIQLKRISGNFSINKNIYHLPEITCGSIC
jgi:hypothetical protein